MPNSCIPFEPARARQAGRRRAPPRRQPVDAYGDNLSHLSPAQCAFLSGVLAILADHGEEALTKSCQMVIERFGRKHAG